MQYNYAVELRTHASGAQALAIVTQVQAQDRFEAIAMARRYVELQHPDIDLAKIDTWFIPRRLD